MERASLNKSEYIFATASGHDWLIGTEPVAIVRDWTELSAHVGTHWLIGYIGYEQGYQLVEPAADSILHTIKPDELTLPDVYFGAFEKVTKIPIDTFMNHRRLSSFTPPTDVQPTLSTNAYRAAFMNIQQHIIAGDMYQANLTHRLQGTYAGTPLDLLSYMYARQPTAYGALIHTPDFAIVSNSPELFLRIQTGEDGAEQIAETRPMKGTRSRSAESSIDTAARQDLETNVKDHAELDMIIDIHRNDLARTSIPGTVQVVERKHISKLNTVWQTDALIQSHIDPNYSVLDVIAGCFPAGSVTGAPKIRAMEILHALEPTRRNVYCGAIGYIAPTMEVQLNVAIRTAILQAEQFYYSVGGGIVFDSECAAEYQESLTKAAICYAPEPD